MSEKRTFRAIIESAGGGGAYVSIPFDVEQVYGRKRVQVQATIDGEPYRSTLLRMGTPSHFLIVLKEIREKIGKGVGDEVEVILEEDTAPRVVEVPEDLQKVLDRHPKAKEAFDRLSYTHRKEHVNAILAAKKEETRQRRIDNTIKMLIGEK